MNENEWQNKLQNIFNNSVYIQICFHVTLNEYKIYNKILSLLKCLKWPVYTFMTSNFLKSI